MKACPGLRSGIDRSGSLSFAIRGIPSSIRPPNRHSGEGRNPEEVGRGKTARRWKKPTRHPIFIILCGLRKTMVIPAKARIHALLSGGKNVNRDSTNHVHAVAPRSGLPSRHAGECRNPEVGRGKCSAGARPQPRTYPAAGPTLPPGTLPTPINARGRIYRYATSTGPARRRGRSRRLPRAHPRVGGPARPSTPSALPTSAGGLHTAPCG